MNIKIQKTILTALSCAQIFYLLHAPFVKAGSIPPENLKITLQLGDNLRQLPPRLIQQMVNVMQTALQVVAAYPPAGNHFFEWTGNRDILKGKDVIFKLSDMTDPMVFQMAQSSEGIAHNLDALTYGGYSLNSQTMQIGVSLLIDKIFYDEFGQERPDGLVRTIAALGHEIYGNVQSMLEAPIIAPEPVTSEQRMAREILAFTAGVEFLIRVIGAQNFKSLPVKIQNELQAALHHEIIGLASWQNAWQELISSCPLALIDNRLRKP